MTYKIEQTTDLFDKLLQQTLSDWSKEEPDVQFITSDGQKILTHRTILSFYSHQMKHILNDSIIFLSLNVVSIFVPSSSSCVSSLLNILSSGVTELDNEESSKDVIDLANMLGIKLNLGETNKEKEIIDDDDDTSIRDINDPIVSDNNIFCHYEEKIKPKMKPQCIECGYIFKNEDFLIKHRLKKHGDSHIEYKNLEPESQSEYKRELSTDVSSTEGICDICSKDCKSKRALKIHKIIHLPDSEKPYSCAPCGKTFSQKGNFKIHMNRYHLLENRALQE